ncbi:MAG: DUF2953 domain-containing protein [Paracoccaceae bacterium]|nr:DUF2953 domain-containing protein [Paracoccaceae bacterium]
MSLFLGILLVLLALVIGLIVLLLILPLRLELQLTRAEALQFSAALRPFGHIGPRIPMSSRRKPAKPKKKSPARKEKKRQSNPMRIAQPAIRLVTELLATVRFETASLNVRFGLGDPAETGQLYGQLIPLVYSTTRCPRVRMEVEPVFDEATLTGRAALDLSVVPARLIAPILRFGWSAFGPTR